MGFISTADLPLPVYVTCVAKERYNNGYPTVWYTPDSPVAAYYLALVTRIAPDGTYDLDYAHSQGECSSCQQYVAPAASPSFSFPHLCLLFFFSFSLSFSSPTLLSLLRALCQLPVQGRGRSIL